MGIIDKIKNFFFGKEKKQSIEEAIDDIDSKYLSLS